MTYGNYVYACLATGGTGTAPSGTTAPNTYWQVVQNVTDAKAALANTKTVGGISTWEAIYPALDAGGSFESPAGTLANTIGLPDPVSPTAWTHGGFSVFNKEATTQDIMLRSVSRVASDMTGSNTNIAPDPLQAVLDGMPVPWINPVINDWLPSVRYATDAIVLYDGLMYHALRASTGAVPPSPGTPLNANPTFSAGVTPWTAHNSATIAQSSTQAFQGTYSLKITPDGMTANPGALSEAINVIPLATYMASAWVYFPAGWGGGNGGQVVINWFDAFGQYISSSSGVQTPLTAATWTQVSVTATAPANAATVQIVPQLTGTPSASVVSYWDLVSLSCAQTPEWALLSPDTRLRLMLSGYTAQSLTTGSNETVEVVPFVEWYDAGGNMITSNGQARVIPRVASPGTPGMVPNLSYDSFTTGIGIVPERPPDGQPGPAMDHPGGRVADQRRPGQRLPGGRRQPLDGHRDRPVRHSGLAAVAGRDLRQQPPGRTGRGHRLPVRQHVQLLARGHDRAVLGDRRHRHPGGRLQHRLPAGRPPDGEPNRQYHHGLPERRAGGHHD